jgi:hypothetical protein
MRPVPLMLLKMIQCVKDENLQTVTFVEMTVIVVAKILGDSMTVKMPYCSTILLRMFLWI